MLLFKAVEYETGASGEKRSVCDFEHSFPVSLKRQPSSCFKSFSREAPTVNKNIEYA